VERLIWDSHTGVTAVPGQTAWTSGAHDRKGDAYANSMVIAGFYGKIQAKVAASGLA
jgi:hypothetical protein